jgi:nitrobenzene nitroreductase
MDTQESILSRRTIRKYLDKPVAHEVVKRIMTAATWAPSGANSQPWRFYVATGSKRDEFIQAMVEAPGPESPSIEAFKKEMDPALQELLGRKIKGNASEADLKKFDVDFHIHNDYGSYRFFMAPVVIAVTMPETGGSLMAIGAAVENLFIAAQSEGLGSGWLGKPLKFSDTIRNVLRIPEDENLVTCVSLGYPDNDAPINNMERFRLPHDETVHYLK